MNIMKDGRLLVSLTDDYVLQPVQPNVIEPVRMNNVAYSSHQLQ